MSAAGAKRWLYPAREVEWADTAVLAFAYAGGSERAFRPWAKHLPPRHVFVGVERPGRGRRFSEPVVSDPEQVVDEVLTELAGLACRRSALFGHSLGAMLAYEVAHGLLDRGREVSLLVVSGARPPHVGLGRPRIGHLTPGRFLADAIVSGLAAPQLAADAALAEAYLPGLQADFLMSERHRPRPHQPLTAPVAVFGGTGDWMVPAGVLRAWTGLSAAPPSVHLFDGGHMFVEEQADAVRATLVRLLDEASREAA